MRVGARLGSQFLRSRLYNEIETEKECTRIIMIEIKKRLQQDCTEYKPLECSQIDNIERDTYLTVEEMVEKFERSGEARTNYIRALRQSYEPITKETEEKSKELNQRALKGTTAEEQIDNIRNMDTMDATDMLQVSKEKINNLKNKKEKLEKEQHIIKDAMEKALTEKEKEPATSE